MPGPHLQRAAFSHSVGISQQIEGGPGYLQVLNTAHVASAADPFPGDKGMRTIHTLGRRGWGIPHDSLTVLCHTSQPSCEVIHPRKSGLSPAG